MDSYAIRFLTCVNPLEVSFQQSSINLMRTLLKRDRKPQKAKSCLLWLFGAPFYTWHSVHKEVFYRQRPFLKLTLRTFPDFCRSIDALTVSYGKIQHFGRLLWGNVSFLFWELQPYSVIFPRNLQHFFGIFETSYIMPVGLLSISLRIVHPVFRLADKRFSLDIV